LLQLTVKIGDIVDIEGVGQFHVLEKSGRCVKLGLDTKKGPITILKKVASDLLRDPAKVG
jgi:RNA-binding protein YlmH